MSEMLGNYYFMTNRFQSARQVLEKALEEDPSNKSVKKKLILCYIDSGHIDKGFNLFLSLIKQDITYITDTTNNYDSCPCMDILYNFENLVYPKLSEKDYNKVLAILWLYRDVKISVKYFKKVKSMSKNDKNVDEILNILSNYPTN